MSLTGESLRKRPFKKLFQAISTENTNVAEQLRPVIFLLSAISPYGIGVRQSGDQRLGAPAAIIYEAPKFSWRRPLSLYSVGLLLWVVFCFSIQIFNTSLNIPIPIDLVTLKSAGNTSGEITYLLNTNRIASIFVASCRILEFTGFFLSAPLLAQWLNELTAIETEFNANFIRIGVRSTVNVTRLRNILVVFYLILLETLWMLGQCWAFLPQYQFNPKYNLLGYVWFLSHLFFLMVSQLLEDVKMILMFEILRRIYSQIRNSIHHEVGLDEIKKQNVVAWDALITRLRRQVKFSGECCTNFMMVNICETIFAVSVGTYLVIRSAGGDNATGNLGFALNSAFYCVFIMARLYTKVRIAESIYAEERLLVDDLKDSEQRLGAESLEVLQELRNLQQSLAFAPSKIQIGSYCNIDSQLLVQVIVQTIPMLIAVAQFHT